MTGAVPATLDKNAYHNNSDVSRYFQWLPTDITVSSQGSVKIDSYINNLHPQLHHKLYNNLEIIMTKMIPLFESTISTIMSNLSYSNRIIIDDYYSLCQSMDEYSLEKWEELHGPFKDEDDDAYDEFSDNLPDNRESVKLHLPEEFIPYTVPQPFSLHGRKLQVMVKMANIHLSPEKPEFKGGNWHLEGMENESIACTGIYYYGMSNITTSKLTFREMYDEQNFDYDQNEHKGYITTLPK